MTGSFTRRLISNFITLVVIVLAGGFCAAALVRYSPGFGLIPEDLDPNISPATLRALHRQFDRENRLPAYYARYLAGAVRGDLGVSSNLKQPVSELIRDRAPATGRLILLGTAGGWLLGGLLAWVSVWTRRRYLHVSAAAASGLLIAIPPAVLALGFFFKQAPLALALSLALAPRVFGTMRSLLSDRYRSPALLSARARGATPVLIASRYVVGTAAPQLAALLGVTLVIAFGLSIPIEALCDVPGLGALALQAATARDMPLLCGLALLITCFVSFVHAAGNLLIGEHA